MIVIPFRVSIERERQDPQLASKLKAELPGIFNWAVEGLRDLRRGGQFKIPVVCQQAWEDFKQESNPAREFLAECYEAGNAGDRVSCSGLYENYRNWCDDHGYKPLDATKLGKELRKVFPKTERQRETTGQRLWYYQGLRAITSMIRQEMSNDNA